MLLQPTQKSLGLGPALERFSTTILLQMENQEHTSDATNLSPLAVNALLKGRKIEAIKIVRKERGVDLKEARAAVEAYIQRDPVLKTKLKRAGGNSSVGWVLLLVGLVILAWYLLSNLGA